MTDRLHAAATRALAAIDDLISNTFDPGVEALGARHELETALTAPVPPCDCGAPIPASQRIAYCSDRCRWADDDHGPDREPEGDDQ